MPDFWIADIPFLVLIPALLLASGAFSAAETALFNLTRHQRHHVTRSGGLIGETLALLLQDRRDLLMTLLLGNMVVNVLYFTMATVYLLMLKERPGSNVVVLGVLGVLPLLFMILLGEVIPKLAAAHRSMTFARLAAVPLLMLHRFLGPLRLVVGTIVVTPLARLIAPRQRPPELSAQELSSLLELSQHRGVIDTDEERLLRQVLALSQLRVRDLMVPRVDVQGFDLEDDPGRLFGLVTLTGLRRIPVYHQTIDDVKGIVFAREVLLAKPHTTADMRALVRQPMFVPELARADQLLVHFRRTGTSFAVVVDEFGGTAGVVTLEDVVEQMVGPIVDADEAPEPPQVEQAGPGLWKVGADLSVHDWSTAFGATRPVKIGGVSTIGGLVMARLGRLPRVGDRTTLGNLQIEVASMRGRRIEALWLQLGAPGGAPVKGHP